MAERAWRTFAAAATGQSHAAAGAGSSDAHAIAAYPPGGAILIVADGLGAAREGALAARMSVSCALSVLADVDSSSGLGVLREHVLDAVAHARAALLGYAAMTGLSRRALGTTLLVCVATEQGVAFGGVGDGFLVIRANRESGAPRYHLLTLDDPSPIANETPVLAGADEIEVYVIDDDEIDGLALATDGFEPAAVDRPTSAFRGAREGVLDVLMSHVDTARDSTSLHHDVIGAGWDESCADDRTIVMAVAG